MGFLYNKKTVAEYYLEQLTPEQIEAEKAAIGTAEKTFISNWKNKTPSGYIVQGGSDVARALTNFALSLSPSQPAQDELGNPIIRPIEPHNYLTRDVMTSLASRPELNYTSKIPVKQQPGDMTVQPAKHQLFLNAVLHPEDTFIAGNGYSEASTVPIYDGLSGYSTFYPRHVTGSHEEKSLNLKPLAALASIATAGMGGMLAAPAGAGISAGANVGALSAAEAAGYGGLSASAVSAFAPTAAAVAPSLATVASQIPAGSMAEAAAGGSAGTGGAAGLEGSASLAGAGLAGAGGAAGLGEFVAGGTGLAGAASGLGSLASGGGSLLGGLGSAVVPLLGSAIGAGATLYAADKASDAAEEGTQAAVDAQKYAIDTQWKMYQQQREDYAPWREAGTKALGTLTNMVEAGPGQFVPEEDPGYKFGFKNFIEQPYLSSQSAKGKRLSGETAKGLIGYAQDYATTKYDNFLQRYYQSLTPQQSLAGLGMNATGGTTQAGMQTAQNVSGLQGNIGNIQYQNSINQGNIQTGMAAGIAGSFQQGMNNYLNSLMLQKVGVI